MVIPRVERGSGVLDAGVHHHRCLGEQADGVAQVEGVGVADAADRLDPIPVAGLVHVHETLLTEQVDDGSVDPVAIGAGFAPSLQMRLQTHQLLVPR